MTYGLLVPNDSALPMRATFTTAAVGARPKGGYRTEAHSTRSSQTSRQYG